MTNRGLATGLFRAWGILYLIDVGIGIVHLITVFTTRSSPASTEPGMQAYMERSSVLGTLLVAVIAVLLLRGAPFLARVVFPQEETLDISIDAAAFQGILFSAIGLYFLIDGLRDLVGTATYAFGQPSGDGRDTLTYLWAERWKSLLGNAAVMGFGIAVFFGSRGLVNLWRRYWNREGTGEAGS